MKQAVFVKWFAAVFALGLVCYSAVLLWIGVAYGQAYSRGYFSDIITGTDYSLPVEAFFGINTTLNVVVLVGAAVLFAVGAGFTSALPGRRLLFHWSQVLLLLFAAADERLLFHERAGSVLPFDDSVLIFALGLVQLFLLFWAGGVLSQPRRVSAWLLPAALFFGFMVLIDAFGPEEMNGRLALEDLSKTWATACLFVYAWAYNRYVVTAGEHED